MRYTVYLAKLALFRIGNDNWGSIGQSSTAEFALADDVGTKFKENQRTNLFKNYAKNH